MNCTECGQPMAVKFENARGARYDCKPCGVVVYRNKRAGRPRGRPAKEPEPAPARERGAAKKLLARELA